MSCVFQNDRVTFSTKHSRWADIVVPIGGDGTFLLTASRACPLLANDKPIVGFNSDPIRSEGRLLLPKHYTDEPNEAVRKLMQVIYPIQYTIFSHSDIENNRSISVWHRVNLIG